MSQQNMLVSHLVVGILIVNCAGCLPAPERHETRMQSASDVKITIENGKAVVGAPAKTAPEKEEQAKTESSDSEK